MNRRQNIKALLKSLPILQKYPLPSYREILYNFLGKVLYINKKRIGFIAKLEYKPYKNPDIVEMIIDPSISEFKYCMDLTDMSAKPIKYQIYETSEFKENWQVEEILVLDPFRHFIIQVNSKDF